MTISERFDEIIKHINEIAKEEPRLANSMRIRLIDASEDNDGRVEEILYLKLIT